MLITFNNVTFSYGGNLIFENVNFTLHEGSRAGLIGANGEGKTTLIKILLGELESEKGSVVRKNGIKIGYLEQDGGYISGNNVYEEMKNIFSEELSAVEKISTLSQELANSKNEKEFNVLSSKIESLNKFLTARDCFDVDVKIKTVLNGLGFGDMYDRIIDTMSGGEKTRLKLARLLLESPDILILDEPTNHLDINTLYWLEDYLQSFKGSIFVVSHDRYFLDKIVTSIFEIENKKLLEFTGNYSKYKILKEEYNERLKKEYEAQQQERAKLQDYVDRNLARASTAKSAQSRVKQLEKMELIEKPFVQRKPPCFNFTYEMQPYERVLEIENLNLKIGERLLIKDGSLSVKKGDKLAVVGENGTGKTTLLKEIIKGTNPSIKSGGLVNFAFYDQEGLNLDKENNVLSELWGRHTGYTQTEARSVLARSGLFAEDMEKPVKALSGGERAKLALCILECEKGNVLLLDEPTNHLDLPAREGLEKALKNFDGTLIFVSHDRYFLTGIADKVVEIADCKLNYYECNYESYKTQKKAQESLNTAPKKEERTEKKEGSYRSKKDRAEEEKQKQVLKNIEKEIEKCEKKQEEINLLLAEPHILADYIKVNELLKDLEIVQSRCDMLYKEYEKMI